MSDIAIKVEQLGKKYRIGTRKSGDLRESVNLMLDKFRGKSHQHQEIESEYWALKDINFEIRHGEAVGIIGRNGAGKSTLLKILSRITEPTTGRIEINGRVSSLLEVGTGFHPELTGRENIYLNGTILGMRRREVKVKFDEIVDFSGVEKFIDTPIKHYSSGMKVRLAFSVAAHLEPEILLIDEVLAVGDAEFQKKCLGKMEDVTGQGRTVLFVSHNMGAVETLCGNSILLKDGHLALKNKSVDVIYEYLKHGNFIEKRFDHEIVKLVKMSQKKQDVVISLQYDSDKINFIPKFGFVLSNQLGNPVLGGNPNLLGLESEAENLKSGIINVTIKDPKLVSGVYFLSVFVGDGKTDFFKENLSIQINYVSDNKRYKQEIVGQIGSIIPEIFYQYE